MLTDDIRFLTKRALWETENLITCIPDSLWDKRYDEIPMWKYLYHMLFSMDRWYINPADPDYMPPSFHTAGLNDLNVVPDSELLTRSMLTAYYERIRDKLLQYTDTLQDSVLTETPAGCDMSAFLLILGQFRHWHRHMGIIYGFLIADTGKWPYVLNMSGAYPDSPMPNFY